MLGTNLCSNIQKFSQLHLLKTTPPLKISSLWQTPRLQALAAKDLNKVNCASVGRPACKLAPGTIGVVQKVDALIRAGFVQLMSQSSGVASVLVDGGLCAQTIVPNAWWPTWAPRVRFSPVVGAPLFGTLWSRSRCVWLAQVRGRLGLRIGLCRGQVS